MSAQSRIPLSLRHDVGHGIRVALPAPGASAVELLKYVYRPGEKQFESPRPYVHPVRTLSGRLVSVFRPWDHVWHKGITMALPNVGPDNFWGGATYTRKVGWYSDLKNNGSQDHESINAISSSESGVLFSHQLSWRKEPSGGETIGQTVITEKRALAASVADSEDAWVLGWTSAIKNVSGSPIELGSPTTEGRENAGYGGLFWRGPRSFTGGQVMGADGTDGEDVRGTSGDWAGYCGRHDSEDGSSTVVFVDLTRDQNLDTKWFVRAEPFACMNPAPFFDTVRIFEPGETIELRYAVAIADGASDRERMGRIADVARGEIAENNEVN